MATGFSIIGLVLVVALLAALWAGVVALHKAGRNGAWWCLFSGLLLATLGMIGYAGGAAYLFSSYTGSSTGSETSIVKGMQVLSIAALAGSCGVVVFAIGFALHGFRAASAAARQRELEQLASAMSEEINQMRAQSRNP
ncbi:hypothetical protein [Luteolibacter marinus]|uniref:hypothetical protein n=1 Tax=Luteolibacter marinus TaxID=2776705 RepID=UPI00186608FF|nr:hypothetical protein [Luteolibacter marinus]